jgi:fluoride exporter
VILAKEFLLVACGGAVGASLRHLVGIVAVKLFGHGFPIATLTVNVLGSFAMGVFIELLALKLQGSQELRLLVATGVLGGFTTFSAFSLDFVVLYERGALAAAAGYLAGSVVLSILALFAGLAVVRAIAA